MESTELEALATMADGIGADQPGSTGQQDASGPGPQQASAEERNTQALCMVLAMLREATSAKLIFNPPLSTFRNHLQDDQLPALAGPWARVLSHYGVDLGAFDVMNHPVAMALVTTGPALWALATDLRHELAARRAKPVAAEPDSPDPGRGE